MPRQIAQSDTQYLALLSNVAAGDLGLIPSDGEQARLARGTEVWIQPLSQPNPVSMVIRDSPDSIRLWDGRYVNDPNSYHRRALATSSRRPSWSAA